MHWTPCSVLALHTPSADPASHPFELMAFCNCFTWSLVRPGFLAVVIGEPSFPYDVSCVTLLVVSMRVVVSIRVVVSCVGGVVCCANASAGTSASVQASAVIFRIIVNLLSICEDDRLPWCSSLKCASPGRT